MSAKTIEYPAMNSRHRVAAITAILLVWSWAGFCVPAWPLPVPSQSNDLEKIQAYIADTWGELTRSMTECATVADPKSPLAPVLYLPAGFAEPAAVENLAKSCRVEVQPLPAVIEKLGQANVQDIRPAGLLYLPHPYVVPGGMFNEMYGWDSYFILRGLLRAGKPDLARGIVENFFFELDHYGGILNANRTYYLTRSQPPFLTSMILAVHESEKAQGRDDRAWLAVAYPYALKDYALWTQAPHLAGATGLSRCYDFGEGPAPEMGGSAPDYYRSVARYFLLHHEGAAPFLVESASQPAPALGIGPQFSLDLCETPADASPAGNCAEVERVGLSPDFYKGDRSMRESGFDISFRFGPYGAATHHYAAVCLNSLLYKEEKDLEEIAKLLDHPAEAAQWGERARRRQEAVNHFFWNPDRGLFFDYNTGTQTPSSYEYATTSYPLWAGLASTQQARAEERNLKLLEEPGGLAMSRKDTGAQRDYPYGWAPVHLLAIEGLRRYGDDEDANRLSYEFLSTVLEDFRRDGTIREKYNVVTRSSQTHIRAGYTQNVVGFGWTNGVFLELLRALPREWLRRLDQH